ncbi:hypothetical protein BC629DRAFT_1194074 [Irpex lacteus]|nr:hypothetical protein BC629DRAFT_1194074 [Irpex lacteus]
MAMFRTLSVSFSIANRSLGAVMFLLHTVSRIQKYVAMVVEQRGVSMKKIDMQACYRRALILNHSDVNDDIQLLVNFLLSDMYAHPQLKLPGTSRANSLDVTQFMTGSRPYAAALLQQEMRQPTLSA